MSKSRLSRNEPSESFVIRTEPRAGHDSCILGGVDPFVEYAAWAYPISLVIALPMISSAAMAWIFRGKYSREARRDHTIFALAGYCLMAVALGWSFTTGPLEVETFRVLWLATIVAPPFVGAGLVAAIPFVARARVWSHRVSIPSLAAWGLALIVPGLTAIGIILYGSVIGAGSL